MNLNDPDLQDFMKQIKPSGKQSRLAPFRDQILYLKKNGYAEKEILQFLKEKKGITVSQPTLNVFIKGCLNNDVPADKVKLQQPSSGVTTASKSSSGSRSFTLRKTPMEDLIG